jgi:hypothetical protein
MEVVEAVNEPPVEVGREREGGRWFAIVAETSRAAMDVKRGPVGPIV